LDQKAGRFSSVNLSIEAFLKKKLYKLMTEEDNPKLDITNLMSALRVNLRWSPKHLIQ